MATVVEAPEPSAKPTTSQNRTPQRRKGPSLFLKLGLLASSLVIAFLAVELGLRLFVPVTGAPYYFWDPVVGPRRQPNTAGRYISGNHINTEYHFNSQGWNHPADYTIAKPDDTLRVCIVGDSFVEALQVDADQAMSAVAEKKMSREDRPVQWYPFGISGWGTTQELEVIRHYVLDYKPNVVVMLFVENDPFDSSPYLGPIEPYITTYALDDNDELELLPPGYWNRTGLKRAAVESALVRYLMLQKGWVLRPGESEAEEAGIQRRAGAFAGGGHDVAGIEDMTDEERQQKTWLLIEKTLEATRDLCEKNGAQFVLAYRGNLPKIEAAAKGETYEPAPKEEDPYNLGSRLFEMGEDQLAPIAEQLHIPFIDLTDTLIEKVAKTGQSSVFPVDTHYNALSHQAVGEALAEMIEPMLPAPAQQNRDSQ